MRRPFKALAVAILLLLLAGAAIVAVQLLRDPGSAQPGSYRADDAGQVRRGAYLARAGNCIACHTVRGGEEYAGGRAIATPFGNLYAPNITPDTGTGIGSWSADDFWRAIHNGKAKDGRFLYPAFPYPNYTKVTRADADAMYAYFRTVVPVHRPNRPHALRFPYNQRLLLAFWRALYFSPGEYVAEAARGASWNRGAYLVQGLGHCAACHTARDRLGGPRDASPLAGATIPMQGWYAPPLAGGSGAAGWQADQLAALLKTGVSTQGAVYGPMAEVVKHSLQHLDGQDIGAMVDYLQALAVPVAGPGPVRVPVPTPARPMQADAATSAVLRQGAALYGQHCASCHRADGGGMGTAYPPLADKGAAAPALNQIRMVLNGGYPPSTGGNPRPYGMPPFGHVLDDAEVAAVVSYIRMRWSQQGTLVSPPDVGRSRGVPLD